MASLGLNELIKNYKSCLAIWKKISTNGEFNIIVNNENISHIYEIITYHFVRCIIHSSHKLLGLFYCYAGGKQKDKCKYDKEKLLWSRKQVMG